jgi:hypothetical protein
MKVAVINFSGNVGKSTIAKHLLLPRIKNASFIAVESINADEGEGDVIRGKQFGQLQEQMLLHDSMIVDIGASNVEDFIKFMQLYRSSHEDFDYFIVPTVKENKQMKDTISTIRSLASMNIPANKIRVVFNKLETDETIEEAFYPLLTYYDDSKAFYCSSYSALYYNELYQKIRSYKLSIHDLLNDKTDYKSALNLASDKEEKMKSINMITMQRLAISAKENLDLVYKSLLN